MGYVKVAFDDRLDVGLVVDKSPEPILTVRFAWIPPPPACMTGPRISWDEMLSPSMCVFDTGDSAQPAGVLASVPRFACRLPLRVQSLVRLERSPPADPDRASHRQRGCRGLGGNWCADHAGTTTAAGCAQRTRAVRAECLGHRNRHSRYVPAVLDIGCTVVVMIGTDLVGVCRRQRR